ncbi:unnamed protein product [Caenorhabditis bovis]|uniref:Uncharacterized protein n=1 Tax=Caenorhabditis bovis TaxID=2654633 RepID=A0A8S1EG15_9PELO|nr:unnamed protein product [Caenorhabditis bovis]
MQPRLPIFNGQFVEVEVFYQKINEAPQIYRKQVKLIFTIFSSNIENFLFAELQQLPLPDPNLYTMKSLHNIKNVVADAMHALGFEINNPGKKEIEKKIDNIITRGLSDILGNELKDYSGFVHKFSYQYTERFHFVLDEKKGIFRLKQETDSEKQIKQVHVNLDIDPKKERHYAILQNDDNSENGVVGLSLMRYPDPDVVELPDHDEDRLKRIYIEFLKDYKNGKFVISKRNVYARNKPTVAPASFPMNDTNSDNDDEESGDGENKAEKKKMKKHNKNNKGKKGNKGKKSRCN